jgi:hypothetical protein
MVDKEIGLQSRFWKHNNPAELNAMTDEQILQIIDEYLDKYITSYEKRNPGKDLPNIGKTLAEVRNKRTNISKGPIVPGRRPYK